MRFSCFPEEKTLTPVHSWSRWPECKDVCLVFRSRKNCVESKSRSGLLFLCFPSSPRVFCTRIYFFTDKSSAVFFCCCYFWLFLLCFFVLFATSAALIMAVCWCLVLVSMIPWFLCFPPVFFLPLCFFLEHFTWYLIFLFCCCVSCLVVPVLLPGFFPAFCVAFFARLGHKCIALMYFSFVVY